MEVYEAIQNRRTVRRFAQTPLSAKQLRRYANAARLAPSAANLQPLKYVIVSSREMCEKVFAHVRWAGYIAPEGTPKEGERPTAYIAQIADTAIKENGYEFDAGAAMENLLLAAEADGVGGCWMGAIDYREISELLVLKPTEKLIGVAALGVKAEHPVTEPWRGDVKYFKDASGTLRVPKRPTDEVILREV